MKTITVEVKQKHIRSGKPNTGYTCPIALAARQVLGEGLGRIHVSSEEIEIGMRDYPLPKKATNFIQRFDSSKSVKPFSFRLRYE